MAKPHFVPQMRYTFHLPTHDNDGNPQPPAVLRKAILLIGTLASGVTAERPGTGLWVPTGQVEEVQCYHVVCDGDLDSRIAVERIGHALCSLLRQVEIFVTGTPLYRIDGFVA